MGKPARKKFLHPFDTQSLFHLITTLFSQLLYFIHLLSINGTRFVFVLWTAIAVSNYSHEMRPID